MRSILGLYWYRVVHYFVEICEFAIWGLIINICDFWTGTSNKFAIADRAKFSDLQFTDFKMFPCPFLDYYCTEANLSTLQQ